MAAGATPKSWPPIARDILLDAARYYYREMKGPWPVPDEVMEQALEQARKELETREREIYEEASRAWIDRWERGTLDDEMKRAIRETYHRLGRAERVIRPAPKKKSPAQLRREIDQALAKPKPKRYRLTIANQRGRYSESSFTATEDEALAQAQRELDQGAVHVRVEVDVDHLGGLASTLVAEFRNPPGR